MAVCDFRRDQVSLRRCYSSKDVREEWGRGIHAEQVTTVEVLERGCQAYLMDSKAASVTRAK